jgi:hypothetical protein
MHYHDVNKKGTKNQLEMSGGGVCNQRREKCARQRTDIALLARADTHPELGPSRDLDRSCDHDVDRPTPPAKAEGETDVEAAGELLAGSGSRV